MSTKFQVHSHVEVNVVQTLIEITVIRFLILVYTVRIICFPVFRYFLVQFIENNVKIIVDETELRKENNTTSALYLDKKYYSCVVLSESGEFLPLVFVYNSFSRLYFSSLPIDLSTVNSCPGSAPQLTCISFQAFRP